MGVALVLALDWQPGTRSSATNLSGAKIETSLCSLKNYDPPNVVLRRSLCFYIADPPCFYRATALAVGRGLRYAILGYLGFHYGRHIVRFFAQYYWPVLIMLIVFSVAGGLFGLYQYKHRQKGERPKVSQPRPQIRRRTA